MIELKNLSKSKCFDGYVSKYSYFSKILNSETKFNVFFPPSYDENKKNPAIYFLSGLTCNEDNFITKAGAIPSASEYGIVLICPDTSPRNLNIPGDSDSWDFGVGAGFYVDATRDPFKNYQMYSFITSELKSLVESEFSIDESRSSIMGHSMGGHGSLMIGLKNPNSYKSISAFSPIVNPINCPWGIKAFTGYLGSHTDNWRQYDTFELSKEYSGPKRSILVDVGSNDSFKDQLKVDLLNQVGNPLLEFNVRIQEDYDHSYWFISTFIQDDEISFPDLVRLAEDERNLYALRIAAPILFESGNDDDLLKAVKFYEILALEFEEAKAMMFLSWHFRQDAQVSDKWLRRAANLNYIPAVVRIAHSYQAKFPLVNLSTVSRTTADAPEEEDDEAEALLHYSLLAAQNRDSKSCFYLGQCHENGYFCPKSWNKALEFYLLGSDSNCILHASNILMNEQNDTARALDLIATSARKYGIPSLKLVADMIMEKDPQGALQLYNESSSQGDVLSTKILGDCYNFGIGTTYNTDLALEYYEKAISLGLNEAVLPCIRIYLEKKEKSKALELVQTFYKDQEINLDNF